jgi:hypothetical protein
MRRLLGALAGTAALVSSLASCADSTPPAQQQPAQQSGQQQPGQELAGIGSTLDAIDSELASDGSP